MAAAGKLTPIEALRVQVLLDVALRKLEFLSSIAAGTGSELTEFMGDEISRIITEQRDLEKRYEELIAQRSTLTGLMNKARLKEVQDEIQDVARKLRESNKSLCRNLKENPNVQDNLKKMTGERERVQQWLEDLRNELNDSSYSNLTARVEEERRNQELLNEVKKKEREASHTVRNLEAELQREYAEHERETKQAAQEIKELKEELQKNRTESAIILSFEEKKLKAEEHALLRKQAQAEKRMVESCQSLTENTQLETTVHSEVQEFMHNRVEELTKDTEKWQETKNKEVEKEQGRVSELLEKWGEAQAQKTKLVQRFKQESQAQYEREEEQRNQVQMEKQRKQQRDQERLSILFLQVEGREYLKRVRERAAAKKGGKKKKGKKK